MIASILNSVKKTLGLEEGYQPFDHEILTHINSVFFTLNQLGVGPEVGFSIEDDTATWNTFLGDDPNLNAVKTYIYLRVRLLFDPPQTSFAIESMNKQIQELEWRLNVYRENEKSTT